MADLYYIEEGYYDTGYFVYTANAASAINSEFSQSCDAELIAGGGIIEATATFNSDGATSITVNKIVNGVAAFSSEFTQSATISHIEGADLFAFTEASIAAQVDRIRGNNIEVSAVFSVATDVERIQQGDADADAIFSAIIDGLRSRDFNLETQAAFSFAVSIEIVRNFSSSLTSQIVLDFNSSNIINFLADLSSNSATSTEAEKLKLASSDFTSNADFFAVISHIHGADISVDNFATLSADAVATKNILQNIASQTSVSALVSGQYPRSSAMTASARLNAAAAVLLRNITIVQNSGGDFTNIDWTTEASKFGGGSLKITGYTKSLNHYDAAAAVNNGTDLKYFNNGFTYTSTNGTTWTRSSNNLPANLTKVIWTGTQYAGRLGTAIYTSSNGISWTTTNITSPIGGIWTPAGNTIEFFGGFWYIGTQRSNGAAIHRSNNLSTWTLVYSDESTGYASGERRWVSSVNTGSQILFLVQMGGTGNTRYITGTSNGTTWNFTSLPAAVGASLGELAFGNGMLVLMSANFSPTTTYFLHSTSVSPMSWTLRRSTSAEDFRQIVYLGTSWFYKASNRWFAGDLSTMTAISPSDLWSSMTGVVGFVGGKYVIPISNGVLQSSSATSGYQFQTTSVNSGVAGTISYSDPTNDLSNWQTIDFWSSGNSTGVPILYQVGASWNLHCYILNGYFTVAFQGMGFNDTRFSIFHSSSNWTGGWNHIRIAKNNSTGAVAVFCNGVKLSTLGTATYPEANNGPIVFGGPATTSTIYFDEFLVSDQLITDPSAASITVPTGQWTSNSNTDLLLHFNNSITDDSRFQVNPTAFISAVASVSARLTGNQNGSAVLQSTATLAAIPTGVIGANLTAFGDAAVTTLAERIRGNNIVSESTALLSADEDRLRDVNSSISDSFTSNAVNDRLRENNIASESTFTQTAAINKIASAVASVDSQASVNVYITRIQEILLLAFTDGALSAIGNVVRSAESNQSCQATIDVDAVKTAFGASEQIAESSLSTSGVLTRSVIILTEAIASEVAVVVATKVSVAELQVTATLSAVADANTKQGASSLSTFATMSVEAVKTAGGASSLESQANQESTISKTTGYSSALSSQFAVEILISILGKIELYAFTNASLDVVISVTRTTSSSLESQATFVAETFDSLAKVASASLSSTATQSAVAVKRVDPTLIFESIASKLVVVVKAASGDITLSSAFGVNADVEVSRSNAAALSAVASVSIEVTKTTQYSASITSQSTQAATITRTRNVSIATDSIASTLTAVIRVAGFFVNCDVVSTVLADGKVFKGVSSSLNSSATFIAETIKLVSTTASITSRASLSAVVGVRKPFSAVFTSALTFVVEIRDLRLDEIVYVIPGENYVYEIISESRLHGIYGETRIRSVTGESRIRTIQGESRIHIID